MKKAFLLLLVVVCCLCFAVSASYSDDAVIKSKTLSPDDVTQAVKNHLAQRNERFIRIIGIYQKDKEATVFYWYSEAGNRERGYQMSLLQLNSGEWIDPQSYRILKK